MQKCIKKKSTQAHNCQDGNGEHSDNEFFLNNLKSEMTLLTGLNIKPERILPVIATTFICRNTNASE